MDNKRIAKELLRLAKNMTGEKNVEDDFKEIIKKFEELTGFKINIFFSSYKYVHAKIIKPSIGDLEILRNFPTKEYVIRIDWNPEYQGTIIEKNINKELDKLLK